MLTKYRLNGLKWYHLEYSAMVVFPAQFNKEQQRIKLHQNPNIIQSIHTINVFEQKSFI